MALLEVLHTKIPSRLSVLRQHLSQLSIAHCDTAPNYTVAVRIGEGGSARVERALIVESGVEVAIKRMKCSHTDHHQKLARELLVLRTCPHPLMVSLQHAFLDPQGHPCLALTLCRRGSLFDAVRRGGLQVTPELLQSWIAQLVVALNFLHGRGVIYCDLKPENVLLQDTSHLMLCDFDLCVWKEEIQTGQACLDGGDGKGFWGTAEYAAPEVIGGGMGALSEASDWWSLGVLVYELLYGKTPFAAPNMERLVYNIQNQAPRFPEKPQVDDDLTSLMRELLRHKPQFRLGSKGVQDIVRHRALSNTDWRQIPGSEQLPAIL